MKGFKFAWHKALLNDAQLEPLTKLVAVAVWDDANEDGTHAWPGARRLAARTGLSDASVRKHLALARNAGWLERVKVRPPGTRLADEYRLTAPLRAIEEGTEEFRQHFRDALAALPDPEEEW